MRVYKRLRVNKIGKSQIAKFLRAHLRADIRWCATDPSTVAQFASQAEMAMANDDDARIELRASATASGKPAICRIAPRGLSYSA